MLRCALTGTPGTGKTSISHLLKRKVIHLSSFYEQASEYKSEEGEYIIKLDILNDLIARLKLTNAVFEGHTSHCLNDLNRIIILRCDPRTLQTRLSERNYSKEKIRENLEAECMNIILGEALENLNNKCIFEFDTTNFSVTDSARIINDFLDDNIKLEETFDYSERILDWY